MPPRAAEKVVEAETIKDAIESEEIAATIVEEAIEKEEEAIINVEEATDNEVEAVEKYSEAVKDEEDAAEIVAETAIIQTDAEEAIVEASEKISDLVESEAPEVEIKEALSNLEETVQNKKEAEDKLSEAIEKEERAALVLEEKVDVKDEAEEKLNNEIKELEVASENLDVAITQKNQSENELAQAANIDENVIEESSEPFTKGDYVSHGVYGNGDVLTTTKAGKHWSIEVNFDEGKRRILGTFLTKLDKPYVKNEKTKYEPPVEKIEEEEIKTYDEHSGIYQPGTEVLHDIFGKGFVREAEPKGENYKLIINFEDGSEKTLLSTFIKLSDEAEPVVEEAVEAEPVVEAVEAESVVEAVVAEPVAEAVEAEPVVENNDMFKRPSKKVEDVIDLSKPEIQDAEMVDDED